MERVIKLGLAAAVRDEGERDAGGVRRAGGVRLSTGAPSPPEAQFPGESRAVRPRLAATLLDVR